MEPCQGH